MCCPVTKEARGPRALLPRTDLVRIICQTGDVRLWSPPPFTEDACFRLIDLPIEKIIIAGPRVDFDPANLTAETAGMPGWMLLPRRGVR